MYSASSILVCSVLSESSHSSLINNHQILWTPFFVASASIIDAKKYSIFCHPNNSLSCINSNQLILKFGFEETTSLYQHTMMMNLGQAQYLKLALYFATQHFFILSHQQIQFNACVTCIHGSGRFFWMTSEHFCFFSRSHLITSLHVFLVL